MGQIIIPFVYDKITMPPDKDRLILVCKEGKYGFIDAAGTEIFECQWDNSASFSNGYCIVNCGDKNYIIDVEGNVITEVPYKSGSFDQNGFAYVFLNETGQYGLSNIDGKEIMQPIYDRISSLNNELVLLRIGSFNDGHYGVGSKNGEILFDPVYNTISDFVDGYCLVIGDQEWFIINEHGQKVL